MTEMKRTGKCSHCRRPVEGLVFVPVSPLRPKRLKTHQDEPEPEAFYQSVQEFLQQATGHRTASEAPGPPARPGSPLSALPFEPSMTFAGARPGYVFMLGEHGMGYYRDGAETSRSAATRRRQPGDAEARAFLAAGRPAPSLRRVCSGKGWVVHGLLLEYSDGVRTGFFVENDGSPLWLFDNAALLRRGGVWQVAGLCGVGR